MNQRDVNEMGERMKKVGEGLQKSRAECDAYDDDEHASEDKALLAYINEHHEIDMAMRVVAGNGRMNDICAAFRAGAKWQRSLQEDQP
jgi:hypothetical protein